VALHDRMPEVRNLAVALLGDRLSELPTLRRGLEEVSKTGSVPSNRATAVRYLAAAARWRGCAAALSSPGTRCRRPPCSSA
jgi:hypothetical protein